MGDNRIGTQQTMPVLDRIAARPQDEAAASIYYRRDNGDLGERRGFTIAKSRQE